MITIFLWIYFGPMLASGMISFLIVKAQLNKGKDVTVLDLFTFFILTFVPVLNFIWFIPMLLTASDIVVLKGKK